MYFYGKYRKIVLKNQLNKIILVVSFYYKFAFTYCKIMKCIKMYKIIPFFVTMIENRMRKGDHYGIH
ncbi:hypothetical protein D3C73_550360 [compost metagenome]